MYASIRTGSATALGKITGGNSGADGEAIPLSESRDTLASTGGKRQLFVNCLRYNLR